LENGVVWGICVSLLKGGYLIHVFMTENEISYKVIGAIYKVYNELGPGLLESVYEAALCYQLRKDGLKVENQVKLSVIYDGHVLPVDLRLDVLVEDKVIVELKSVAEMKAVYGKQLLTYLKISHLKLGLLVNFDTSDIRSSIHRVVNHL
jgi:GxxExxY protein